MKLFKIVAFLSISFSLFGFSASAGEAWLTDLEAAQAKAKAENKSILVDFTGSDWCGWCIKLDEEVFSQADFKEYAEAELVLVEIDFPRKKQISDELSAKNEELAKKYGVRGFPTILLLSPDGEILGRTGYQRGGAAEYVTHIKDLLN